MTAKRGQVAVYLVLVLVALAILVLTNVSAFLAVRAKNRTMNAGDAAALASARVQAELLNRIGRLNLEHAVSDYTGDFARSLEIVREQKRLAFLGPLECLRAAQAAARANGAKENAEMASILSRHVTDIRSRYVEYPELFPEPWDGAWEEYAGALASVAGEGVVAGADNIAFLDAVECFPLTSKSFYSMVEGPSWCKLVVAGWTGLLDMDSHNMPRPSQNEMSTVVNCEICSLHLEVRPLEFQNEAEKVAFHALLAQNGAEFPVDVAPIEDSRPLDDPSRCYFFYDARIWRDWIEMDPSSKFNFPILGRVKPEFNVMGCSSVCRVVEAIPRMLDDSFADGVWSAAAKPFGRIETSGGASVVTAEEAKGLVLPAYEAVRLVPLSAAYIDGKDLSTADSDWLDHVRDQVPQYLSDGVGGLPSGCRYCRVLTKWEDAEFRAQIAEWVRANAESCTRPTGSGVENQGGTSYAH